ncbi:hypothetical protein SUFG_00018 [Sulfitobacter phage phiCB2047-B]|uniref:Cell wall hydrolase SleB domain-containing protein n=1 Tax=Sulfitobacter phage phiCB2047-B TaxID=754046 RepID=M4PQL4_9CAUD|nr:hypothetical protein SUFG_00018 [Sulfitobacter phage phiCB2047-B]AGH07390.1 hypothetical protein SUFG_00018 [Sulfitobacter phage phiCB2047-B]
MADRRLVWNNLQAPDLSAASAALARANQSFNTSMDTGASILAKYGAGQQEKADNEIISELAGLKDESQYDSWIDGGALQGRNLSSGMRDHLLSMRSNFISDEGVRADTRGTNARTANTRATMGINQAREARSAADYLDMTKQRDFLRENAGAAMDAQNFNSQYGNVVGGIQEQTTSNTRLMLARTLQAEAQSEGYQGMVDVGSVIRNRAASGRFGEGIEGVIMKDGQFSAWNGVTGYAGGEQGQDMNFEPSEDALRAADTILSGQYEDQTGGATHYVNKNISQPAWANNGTFKQRGNHWFGDGDGAGAVNGNTGPIAGSTPVTRTTTRSTPTQDYQQALVASGLFSPSEIDQKCHSLTKLVMNVSKTLLIKSS